MYVPVNSCIRALDNTWVFLSRKSSAARPSEKRRDAVSMLRREVSMKIVTEV